MKLDGNLVFIISGSGARSVPIRQIVRGYPLLSPTFCALE
jgi:hypothetical protein